MLSCSSSAIGALLALAALTIATPLPPPPQNADFKAIVSPSWLAEHVKDPNLAIIDIREKKDYDAGHISGSVSIPFAVDSGWSTTGPKNTTLEMPPVEQVQGLLESAGVTWPSLDQRIVLVSAVTGMASNTAPARVAMSIKYAGISGDRIAILSGGYPAWSAANLPNTAEVSSLKKGSIDSKGDLSFIAYIDEVKASINRQSEGIYLVDARDRKYYNGSTQDMYVPSGKFGHIKSAVSLPTPEAFDVSGAFLSFDALKAVSAKALSGGAPPKKIIVYCHIGRFASTQVFILRHLLGYEDVKLYDGSTNEWGRENDFVVS